MTASAPQPLSSDPPAPPPASAVSVSATRWALALLTGMNLLNYIDRFVLPAIVESVKRDIPMTDGEEGFALTSFILVYMLAAPLFGRMGDRGTRKNLVALGVALWSLATAAAAFARSYPALLAARAAVGVGEAAYATLAPSLIGDYYPRDKRGRVMALFYLAIPVGSALGYVLGGQIEHAAGWRAAFLAVGVPGLLLAAAALTITEPPRGQFDTDEPAAREAAPLATVLRALGRNAEYVWTVAGYTLYTFALGGLAQWMPAYLIRVRHLDSAYANRTFGTLTVLGGLLGTAAGGALGEALKRRVRHPYLWLSGVTALLAAPATFFAFRAQSTTELWALVFVAELLAFASTGPINAVLVNCVPAAYRTTAFAVSIFCIHVFGDAISPTLIGVVSDRTSLQFAVLLVPVTFAIGGGLWLYAQRVLPGGDG